MNEPLPPPGPSKPPLISPEEIGGWLVEEDDDFLVFDKPGWVVCHPSKDGPWSSLVGAVRAWRGMATAHLVSRLDRETSGVILLAKHPGAASVAQTAMERRWVEKTYLAVLEGDRARIVGRSKDIIVRGGENLSPAEVEAVIRIAPPLSCASMWRAASWLT